MAKTTQITVTDELLYYRTLCCKVSWLSGSRLNHKVHTILEYNAAISTMAAVTMAVQYRKKTLVIPFPLHAQALSFTFKARNSGMWTISEKIQEPGMITWNSEG